jgi:hypothetical protein
LGILLFHAFLSVSVTLIALSTVASFYVSLTLKNSTPWKDLASLFLFPWVNKWSELELENCPESSSFSHPYANFYPDFLKTSLCFSCLSNLSLAIRNSELMWSLSLKASVIYTLSISSSLLVIIRAREAGSAENQKHF